MSDISDAERAASEYDAMGSGYADLNVTGPYNRDHEWPALIGLIGEVAGRRVLDVGCGPGTLTAWLADQGALVTGVDISSAMLAIASARLGDRARLRLADATRPLGFLDDASTDLVVASLFLHYVRDWEPVLADWRRLLAPGGAAVLSTHHPSMDWQLFSPDDYFAVKQLTDELEIGGRRYPVTFWRRPLTMMTGAIASAGFLIEALVEPGPATGLFRRDQTTKLRLRRAPRFLFFRLRPAPAASA